MKAFGNIAKDGQVRAVASGALSSGKPVVVNSDGTVSVVSETASNVGSIQASTVAGNSGWVTSALPNTSAFVGFAQSDSGNSNYGTAIVGTVSGSTITYGTKAQATTMTYPELPNVIGMTSTTFVIVYKNSSASNRGEARVGTISGTGASATISFGSAVTFESGQTQINQVHTVDRLTDTKFVIAFEDASDNGKGKCIVGTVSGTSVSFGSPATFSTANTSKYASISALSETKIVVAWSNTPTPEAGKVIIGTVSGTSISYGSPETYDSDRVVRHSVAAVSDSKFVIAYNDNRLSTNYGTAIAGTVSGDAITLGTPVVWRSSAEGNAYPSIVKITSDSFVIAGLNDDARASIFEGSLSGTTITFGSSPIQFRNTGGTEMWATLVNDEKVVIGFQDSSNSDYLSASVYTPLTSTLTSENYIGMSKGVVIDASKTSAVDSTAVFLDADVNNSAVVFDSSNNKFVVAFKRGSDSKGCAVVGTVSGTSISYGSVVEFEQGNSQYVSGTFDSSNNKVVLCFRDYDDSQHGKAVVGTVSGTSISFGTAVTFNSAATEEIFPTFDSNSNKVVIGYRNDGDSKHGYAIVGTVSGTSISFGSATEFENARVSNEGATFDSNSNKVVFTYRDHGNSNYGTAIIGTVSGTSISFGTPVVYESASSNYNSPAFDSNENKVLIAFVDGGDSDKGKAIVGTVSGTSISFGSVVEFETDTAAYLGNVFDSNANKFLIGYADGGDSNFATLIEATVSGTSVSFGSSTRANASVLSVDSASLAFDSNAKKVLMTYRDNTNTKGRSVLYQVGYTDITRGQVTNGQSASIDSTNAISRNQLGLTAGQTYFVQSDGTIGLTADSPSVTAGTAISATELIVKG